MATCKGDAQGARSGGRSANANAGAGAMEGARLPKHPAGAAGIVKRAVAAAAPDPVQ